MRMQAKHGSGRGARASGFAARQKPATMPFRHATIPPRYVALLSITQCA